MTNPWTPGPFYVVELEHSFRIHTKPDGGYHGTLADISWWSNDDHGPTKLVAHANAHLFAAAHELVDALDELLSGHDNLYVSHFGSAADPMRDIATHAARAVLARVRVEAGKGV